MILADTSILIDFLKKPTDSIKKVFLEESIFICGITRSEVLHGARDNNNCFS